jgi:hypothetical protein
MYITGNIGPYVRLYFNKLNGTDTACSDSEVFLLLPGITITQTLMLPISGFISLRINHRLYVNFSHNRYRMVAIGAFIGILMLYISAQTRDFWSFFVCYSCGFGLMIGISVSAIS